MALGRTTSNPFIFEEANGKVTGGHSKTEQLEFLLEGLLASCYEKLEGDKS